MADINVTSTLPYKPARLVEEDTSYDNLVANPILKPIAIVEKTINDFDEMLNKKLTEANRDKDIVDKILLSSPLYGDSEIFLKMRKINECTSDIIKMQDIIIKQLKDTIREINELVKIKYGLLIEEIPNTSKREEPIYPEFYLEDLRDNSEDEEVREFARKILEVYKTMPIDSKVVNRFEDACAAVYKDETDKRRKIIVSNILRRDYNSKRRF